MYSNTIYILRNELSSDLLMKVCQADFITILAQLYIGPLVGPWVGWPLVPTISYKFATGWFENPNSAS